MLLCEYSKDVCSLFSAAKEFDFFKSKKQLISKIKYYIENDNIRKNIAKRGKKRVIADRHDVISRMKIILDYYNDVNIHK